MCSVNRKKKAMTLKENVVGAQVSEEQLSFFSDNEPRL